jgi:C4-dicarboxylate transporter
VDKKINEELNRNILERITEMNFDYSKIQNSTDSKTLNTIYQIRILTNQFLSFYKVTFVEEDIDKLDIITISILSSFITLIKEYSKNTDTKTKIKSLNYIIESMDRSLSVFINERQNLLKL